MTTVLVNFIQDRSGSMQSVWDETVKGFKTFIDELKTKGAAEGIKYLFSFTAFDTVIEHPIHEKELDEVDVEEIRKFAPRGMTALYDAVGQALEAVKATADKYVGVIVTDGHENSSREWDKDKLNRAIESKLNAGNWSFVYLGTQPETWGDAAAVGLSMGAVASYTPKMARSAYQATAGALHSHAISTERGTRQLFANRMSAATAKRAGMRLWSEPTPSTIPVPPRDSKKPLATSRRWR